MLTSDSGCEILRAAIGSCNRRARHSAVERLNSTGSYRREGMAIPNGEMRADALYIPAQFSRPSARVTSQSGPLVRGEAQPS